MRVLIKAPMAGIFLALCLGIALTEKFGNMYLIFITPLILIVNIDF